MDSVAVYVSDYWWVIVLPALLMILIWLFQGRGLRWLALFCVTGLVLFYFSDGRSSGFLGALNQFLNQVVDVVRRVGASLL